MLIRSESRCRTCGESGSTSLLNEEGQCPVCDTMSTLQAEVKANEESIGPIGKMNRILSGGKTLPEPNTEFWKEPGQQEQLLRSLEKQLEAVQPQTFPDIQRQFADAANATNDQLARRILPPSPRLGSPEWEWEGLKKSDLDAVDMKKLAELMGVPLREQSGFVTIPEADIRPPAKPRLIGRDRRCRIQFDE